MEQNQEELLLLWHTHSKNIKPNFSAAEDKQLFQLSVDYIREESSLQGRPHFAIYSLVQKFVNNENVEALTNLIIIRKKTFLSYGFQYIHTLSDLKDATIKINDFFDLLTKEVISTYWELYREKHIFLQESHQERLTMLGQMSASFVHEFRNPLTSIMGFVKLLQAEEKNISYLDIISDELQQLNGRISQFLTVSKKDILSKSEEFSLGPLLDEIISFLYPTISNANITIYKSNCTEHVIRGVQSQIRQVLLNIFINSIDALQLQKDSERSIVITVEEKDELLEITIKNNGPMIPNHKVATIFEPFVTTKKHGTGIGLFVCKQIIKKHGGDIYCESSKDWTTFCFQLQKENVMI